MTRPEPNSASPPAGARADGADPNREAGLDHVGRRLSTLEQCALHRRTIRAACPSCGRVRRFDAVALWWLYQRRGWPGDLPDALGRLCCSRCAAHGRVVRPRAEVTRERPDPEQPPYPDEATWKRLVSRYRS